jgi:hypothetical protein
MSLGDFSFAERLREVEGEIDEGYTIRHIPSGSLFEIFRSLSGGGIRATARLGDDPIMLNLHAGRPEDVVDRVRSWALGIPKWMDTPDLWKSMPDTSSIPGDLIPESDNTPFTPDGQVAISAQLKEIAESVKKAYELTAEQSARLDEKFEEAEKASRRILSDTITPAIMGDILMMMQHGIGHLFSGPAVSGVLSAGQD